MNKIDACRLKLNDAFEERDKNFPIKVKANSARTSFAMRHYLKELFKIDVSNWKPNDILVNNVSCIINSPVFICGSMKSGTSMLLELLDSHPELIIIPTDSHMVNQMYKDSDVSYDEIFRTLYYRWLSSMINPTGQKPFWVLGKKDSSYLYFLNYMKFWRNRLPKLDSSPFCSVVASFYCANPSRPLKPKLWVEKTPHNELRTKDILKLFPNAKFIHILRNPYDNTASIKKLYGFRGWNWDARVVSRQLRENFDAGVKNENSLGKCRYLIINYEDVISNYKSEMSKVSDFLKIVWNDSLLRPTFNGRKAKSNSMYKDKLVEGQILNDRSKRWKSELDSNEIAVIKLFWGNLYS